MIGTPRIITKVRHLQTHLVQKAAVIVFCGAARGTTM